MQPTTRYVLGCISKKEMIWCLTSKMSVWLDATKWLWLTKDEGLLLALEVVVVVLMRLLLVGDVTKGGCVLLLTVVPTLLVLFDDDEEAVVLVLEVELLLALAWSCWWACKAAATCCWCPIKAANCLDLKEERGNVFVNYIFFLSLKKSEYVCTYLAFWCSSKSLILLL